MTEAAKISASRKERMIRGILLLASSALFTGVAWFAGAYDFADKNWTYLSILGVIVLAAIVSRFGAKWIMRRLE